jgi:hypothetical protein
VSGFVITLRTGSSIPLDQTREPEIQCQQK